MTRRRTFVSWREFRQLACEFYASTDGPACLPVKAVESTRRGARLYVASQRCGLVAIYEPSIADDGVPTLRRRPLPPGGIARWG